MRRADKKLSGLPSTFCECFEKPSPSTPHASAQNSSTSVSLPCTSKSSITFSLRIQVHADEIQMPYKKNPKKTHDDYIAGALRLVHAVDIGSITPLIVFIVVSFHNSTSVSKVTGRNHQRPG